MSQRSVIWCCVLFLLVMITASVSGQPPGRPARAGYITILKQALEEAGATALSADQEKQIEALVDSIHESLMSKQPDEALQGALSTYRDAVLSGNLSGAKSAAAALASQEAENSRIRLEEQANWMIQLLAILTPDQLNKLVAQFDTDGTFQVLQRLTGRAFGGPGFRGGPGSGPMRGRAPRE